MVQLLECEKVPLWWRTMIALQAYLYCRPGELRALEWEDIDLEAGRVHVHRAIDRADDEKPTKTNSPRKVPIEPTLRPLLKALGDEAGWTGRVAELLNDNNLSRALQRHLRAAGIDRRELLTS